MEDLGLDAAAARLVQDDFCKSDGLMTFSTLPSDVQQELQEVLGSEVDEDEIELSNAEEEVLEEDAESADEADEEEELLEEPEPWPWSVMTEVGPWRFVAKASGESLGVLHAVGQDGLKATCKRPGHRPASFAKTTTSCLANNDFLKKKCPEVSGSARGASPAY